MIYTCDRCGKEFETPIMVDSGGEYGGTSHKEPASPCCNDDYSEESYKEFQTIDSPSGYL